MLKKNKIYTSRNLLSMFGGSIQPSMPIVGGKVPYCKFDKKINPNFPREAWIEVGPLRKKGAEILANSKTKVPVFEKIQTNQWKYLGNAIISDVSNNGRLNQINHKPPRAKVQKILKISI